MRGWLPISLPDHALPCVVRSGANTERSSVRQSAYGVAMPALREQSLSGFAHLEAVTALLQRIRRTHATAGLWEAADRQWSWRTPRPSDDLPQLFWLDEGGQPAAAVIMTESAQGAAFDRT
jgi:hypothetical protein